MAVSSPEHRTSLATGEGHAHRLPGHALCRSLSSSSFLPLSPLLLLSFLHKITDYFIPMGEEGRREAFTPSLQMRKSASHWRETEHCHMPQVCRSVSAGSSTGSTKVHSGRWYKYKSKSKGCKAARQAGGKARGAQNRKKEGKNHHENEKWEGMPGSSRSKCKQA